MGLSPRLSNPFWTQVLERWKAIRPKLYNNPNDMIHTNICNSTKTSFIIHIPLYRYVPLNLIVDHNFNILPPSELRCRIPPTQLNPHNSTHPTQPTLLTPLTQPN